MSGSCNGSHLWFYLVCVVDYHAIWDVCITPSFLEIYTTHFSSIITRGRRDNKQSLRPFSVFRSDQLRSFFGNVIGY